MNRKKSHRELSEEELIKACVRGKKEYQEPLYRLFAPKMYTLCLSYANDREQALDILQDGFVKMFRRLDSFDFEGSFEGWLRKIMVNTAIDFLRKDQKTKAFLDVNTLEIKGNRDEGIMEQLGLEDILKQLKKLPEGARMVFNLYAIEGYNHREIADMLSISVGTSKSQYNRARNLLQEWLRKEA